jgi:hypothetical protein
VAKFVRPRTRRRREGRELVTAKLDQLQRMSLDQLRGLVESPESESLEVAAGRRFSRVTYAFWDTVPQDSLLYVKVVVKPQPARRWTRGQRSGLTVVPHTGEVERHLRLFEPEPS